MVNAFESGKSVQKVSLMGSVKCSTMPHQQISVANIITGFNSPIQRSHFARREFFLSERFGQN